MTITIADDAVYYCLTHKETPSVVIEGDDDLANLGVKALCYCPILDCKSFRCNDDDDADVLDSLYTRFNVSPLSYVVPTQEQRTLQRFLRHIFFLTVRVAILSDKEKRWAVQNRIQ